MPDSEHFDPYAVLGVPPTATLKEIKAAYRRLSKQSHSDQTGQKDDEVQKSLNRAWEMLSDPLERSAFDRFGIPARELRDSIRTVASRIFVEVLIHEGSGNAREGALGQLDAKLEEHCKKLRAGEELERRVADAVGRISPDPGSEFLMLHLGAKIHEVRLEMQHIRAALHVVEGARQLLSDIDFRADPPAPTVSDELRMLRAAGFIVTTA